MKEKLDIIQNQFGLDVKRVEDSVYKVLNTDKEINIDKLQWALEECILITSPRIRYEKTGDINTKIANVYYICLDISNKKSSYNYKDKAKEEFGKVIYKYYKYNPVEEHFITTIYSKGE